MPIVDYLTDGFIYLIKQCDYEFLYVFWVSVLELLLISVHIFSSVLLIVLILLQQGKGAEAGATLGGGDNSSLFGPMTENPLQNATTIIAAIFMITSVSLAYKARFPDMPEQRMFFKEASEAMINSGNQGQSAEAVLDHLGIPQVEAGTSSEESETLPSEANTQVEEAASEL